ncbi:MAG: Ig-like domain-containing protein, partial [Plesiomonas sp.]|uniref:Ig-like domain-containing protein n=1 Tax=Plesiomonas sp. TaxID=2486279 RepID=UPI003F3A329B
MKNKRANINMVIFKYLFMSIFAFILVGCNEDNGPPTQKSDSVVITALQIISKTDRIPLGLDLQLTANAEMSNGKIIDATSHPSITWRSSDTQVMTVDDKGRVTGVNVGNAIITASGNNEHNQYFEATTSIEITSAIVTGLQVTPPTANIAAGLTTNYIATAILSDNSTVDITQLTELTWESSDETIATISNDPDTKGQATGITPGVVTITASGNVNGQSFSATAQLTVSNKIITGLRIEPESGSIPAGLDYTFTALAIFSDGSTRDITQEPTLTWSSDNITVATITSSDSKQGIATGIKTGTAVILASTVLQGKTFSDTATLTVTDAVITGLEVTPTSVSVAAGLSTSLTATAFLSDGTTKNVTEHTLINWRSLDTSIATVSNTTHNKGSVTGVKPGEATITASGEIDGKLFSASAQITITDAVVTQLRVTPNTTSIALGLQHQLNVEARFSDGSVTDVTNADTISWISSNPSIATVSSNGNNKGMVTGVSSGKVTITASGEAYDRQFSATAEITITNAVVTQLNITPDTASIPLGLKLKLNAKARFSDGSVVDVTHANTMNWIPSDSNIATVSNTDPNKGMVTAVAQGSTTITALFDVNGQTFNKTAQIEVITPVLKDIVLSASSVNITPYYGAQLKATAMYINGTSYDITEQSLWSSSPNVAVIDGYVSTTEFVAGQTGSVTASYEGKVSSSTEVNMVVAQKSLTIGHDTAYSDIISSNDYSKIRFQG